MVSVETNKQLSDILFIIQARCNSERVPNKMLRPFANTNLFEIAIEKVKKSCIPNDQFRASVFEPELKAIVDKHGLLCYNRSETSANNDTSLQTIYEWHDQFPEYKYAVIINACNLFLEVNTIDKFVQSYLQSEHDGLFAVMPKKQYYWDSNGNLITEWPEGNNLMNTKAVGVTYEAAHVLYAGRLDMIADGMWMGKPPYTKNAPALIEISEFESLDIDYEWQFEVYTTYWEKIYGTSNS
jgi:CMP-N-acetylneuraminic acid synthetase